MTEQATTQQGCGPPATADADAPSKHEDDVPDVSEYGIIGDRHTAALLARGSVDWWCPRRFDGPSACARLLDPGGGSLMLRPSMQWTHTTRYIDHSNVLRTTWRRGGDVLEVDALMPLDPDGAPAIAPGAILLVARCTAGSADVRFLFRPRPAYGAQHAQATREGPGRVRFSWSGGQLVLASTADVERMEAGAHNTWKLSEGETVAVAVGTTVDGLGIADAERMVRETSGWWSAWARKAKVQGPHREAVLRGSLVLGLLTYAPTGGLVAAPTTSIPEWPGTPRTWDYRYVWLRDAALAVDAWNAAGHDEQALELGSWIHRALQETAGRVEVLSCVDGTPGVHERTLDDLEGYRGGAPVRMGNMARLQHQLDVYGEVVQCLRMTMRLDDGALMAREWDHVRAIIDHVCRCWREPDEGIWEMRGPPRHFILSKVMAWVAIKRGISAAEERGLPGDLERWRNEAEEIRRWVLENGIDRRRRTFVQHADTEAVDASNLLIPMLGFVAPDDPLSLGTIQAVQEDLAEGILVQRYRDVDDGVEGPQAPFVACSFWLVEALVLTGRVREARAMMDDLLAQASPLGLFAQNLDAQGRHWGNYPQALSHIALISAAAALERAERGEQPVAPLANGGASHDH